MQSEVNASDHITKYITKYKHTTLTSNKSAINQSTLNLNLNCDAYIEKSEREKYNMNSYPPNVYQLQMDKILFDSP